MAESERRRAIREACDKAKADQRDRPITAPGQPSPLRQHTFGGGVRGMSDRRNDDAKKQIGREHVKEHEESLKEKEYLRRAQIEERNAHLHTAECIVHGM